MLDTAIVPCGGLGTRLHPITRWIPKELLPIGLKPQLFWTLDELADAGLARAIVITNPHKPLLETAARNYAGPLELHFIPQHQPRGLGDALCRARDELGGDPFAVALPDNLFRGPNPTSAVVELYRRTRLASVLLAEVSAADSATKGATGKAKTSVAADGTLRVTEIADKGKGRFATAAGTTAATPIGRIAFPGDVFREFDEVARQLAPGAELDDVPVLQRLAARGVLAGVFCEARFYDVGVPEGYHQAVTEYAAQA